MKPTVVLLAAVVFLPGCSAKPKAPAAASAPHGPLAALMTRHASATCGKSDHMYDSVFFHPPYQTCTTGDDDPAESAEIDSDSVVVELYNTWTAPPSGQAALFSQGESELTSRFGTPRRCNATTLEWRRGDSLDVLLQIAPTSQVGTEFDEGPYRMTRQARLGPLDGARWGC